MTIQEIHRDVRFWLDRQSTGVTPSVQVEDIDLAINDTCLEYVKSKYRPVKELLSRNVGFEEIQKRIDDLSKLVKTGVVTLAVDTLESDVFVGDLTSLVTNSVPDYMFFLRARVKIGNVYRPARLIKHASLDVSRLDPFNRSSLRKPSIYFESNQIRVIKPYDSNDDVSEIRVTYLRMPTPVNYSSNVTLDMNEHTHGEIVKLCVRNMLELFESRRDKTLQQEALDVE